MFACHSCSGCTACMNVLVDVSCLCEQGAQKYANIYVDRQVGKSIKPLEPSILIGRTFLGPTPSTEYIIQINTFRSLNLMISIRM